MAVLLSHAPDLNSGHEIDVPKLIQKDLMENQRLASPQASPMGSPMGSPCLTSNENTRMNKTKSWGRMISIRAQIAAESADQDITVQAAGKSASQTISNEQELAELVVDGSSEPTRTDSKIPQTSSTGSQCIQNRSQSPEAQRVFVRHRSCRSVQISDQKGVARSMLGGAPTCTSPDRHACSYNIVQILMRFYNETVP